MASAKQALTFNGKGDVNTFITKTELYIKLKKLEGEDAAMLMASRLDDPAFHIYLRLSEEDKKDVAKIKEELKRQYESGNSDREEALCLLSSRLRKEGESLQDYAFCISELVRLAYPSFETANRQIHEKDYFMRLTSRITAEVENISGIFRNYNEKFSC